MTSVISNPQTAPVSICTDVDMLMIKVNFTKMYKCKPFHYRCTKFLACDIRIIILINKKQNLQFQVPKLYGITKGPAKRKHSQQLQVTKTTRIQNNEYKNIIKTLKGNIKTYKGAIKI